jgi:hypothetical protein
MRIPKQFFSQVNRTIKKFKPVQFDSNKKTNCDLHIPQYLKEYAQNEYKKSEIAHRYDVIGYTSVTAIICGTLLAFISPRRE